MAGKVIEVLSGKKMALLALALLSMQITFFLIGGLIAPKPSDAQEHIMINCKVAEEAGTRNVIARENCNAIDDLHGDEAQMVEPDQMVLMTYIPRPQLAMIPWFQYLLALLQVKITLKPENKCKPTSPMLLHIDILYSDEIDYEARLRPSAWTSLASCEEERILECVSPDDDGDQDGYECDCGLLHLFQLGSVPHKYYLVNLRLPVKHAVSPDNPVYRYNTVGNVKEISIIAIRQTGGFTKVWILLKTALTFIMVPPTVWFWRRILMQDRKPLLIEKAIFSLATSMVFLNLPLELVSIYFEAPWMLFFTDIRQGFFYAVLLSFWIIFVGEHMMDQPHRNRIAGYKWQLGLIFTSMSALLAFDIAERGMQLVNPCTTIWNHHNIATGLIIMASIGGCLYFFLLLFMVVKVFRAISYKNRFLLSTGRREKFRSIVFRFRLLMLLSVATAGLTVAFYILSQKYDDLLDWGEHHIEVNSAFFTGVYGLWNIYVLLLLSAYAPSHKQQTSVDGQVGFNSRQELIALNATDYNQPGSSEQAQIFELTQQKTRED